MSESTNSPSTHSMLRRSFLPLAAGGLGWAAFNALLGTPRLDGFRPEPAKVAAPTHAKARRVIYLCQAGGPSQLDMFDYKLGLQSRFGAELPDSVRGGQRLTTFTNRQLQLPIAPSLFKFAQHGQSGLWFSELLPHMASIADEFCMVRSVFTEPINHDPAITFLQTGSQLPGRPSMGAWLSYGLGSANNELPAFVVLTSLGNVIRDQQPVYDRLWGAGFLPSKFQGVKFRNNSEPVPFLANPPGVSPELRRQSLDDLAALNRARMQKVGDPEIETRIAQYEMAFRMQASVPALTDLSSEPEETFRRYGPDSRTPGTYAANCIMARRLAERNVRFIQLYHLGWDQHGALPRNIRSQCADTDQPTAALILDLKKHGLLNDTLIVWGGEFGRTVYSQGPLTAKNYGRDHHPRCFTMLFAGAGIRKGLMFGETDDFGYNITRDPVHVHDFNATIMHILGIDHTRLTYRFQGRDYRLTDIAGSVVSGLCD